MAVKVDDGLSSVKVMVAVWDPPMVGLSLVTFTVGATVSIVIGVDSPPDTLPLPAASAKVKPATDTVPVVLTPLVGVKTAV